MIEQVADDGIKTLNALFRDATREHGGDLRAVLSAVRDRIKALDGPRKEAALKALNKALTPTGQCH